MDWVCALLVLFVLFVGFTTEDGASDAIETFFLCDLLPGVDEGPGFEVLCVGA